MRTKDSLNLFKSKYCALPQHEVSKPPRLSGYRETGGVQSTVRSGIALRYIYTHTHTIFIILSVRGNGAQD